MTSIDWDRPKVLKGAICMKFECSEEATHILESPQGMIFYQCLKCATGRAEELSEKLKEEWRVIIPGTHVSNSNVLLGYPSSECVTEQVKKFSEKLWESHFGVIETDTDCAHLRHMRPGNRDEP